MDIKKLQKIVASGYFNLSFIARKAGINKSTIVSKLRNDRELDVQESRKINDVVVSMKEVLNDTV